MKNFIMLIIELRKNSDNVFKKSFYKRMCNAVFGKTRQNARSQKNIKLVTTNNQRNKFVSEPNYHCTKWFSENLLAIEMRKIKVKMNKPIYLGMSKLDISKIPMCEFWYDYLKTNYKENIQLCYMYTDSFIFNVKTKDWNKVISNNVEKRFDTSDIQKNVPRKKNINKKVLDVFKDELNGFQMKEFIGLRAKSY